MTPEEALKKVQAEKPKDNFMLVNIGYDNNVIVPYKDGLAIVAALGNAQLLQEGYSEKTRITEFDRRTFNPKILLADEPTSALDVTTQAQIVRQMMDIKKEFSTAIIIVTHNIGVASFMADKIIVMKNGVIVESGSCKQVIKNPQHEYTQKLLDSVIEIGGKRFV